MDDKFPLFEILKIHEFAWFPKIETLTASCFLQNIYFFLNFWKKHNFFMKIVRFCQKPKARRFFIFCEKNKKDVLGTKSVTKFRKFEVNSRENQANSWASKSLNKQDSMWMFFVFFEFSKSNRKWKGFLDKSEKNFQKIHKKCVKFIKFNQFEHV